MTEKAKKKILIVDDEVNVCKSIRRALECDAYEIETALGGQEALDKESEKNYDLFIVDLMMPGIGGIELLQSLKARSPSAKVIMITGYPTSRSAIESMQLGAFDYLPKPFLPSELRSLISRALGAGG